MGRRLGTRLPVTTYDPWFGGSNMNGEDAIRQMFEDQANRQEKHTIYYMSFHRRDDGRHSNHKIEAVGSVENAIEIYHELLQYNKDYDEACDSIDVNAIQQESKRYFSREGFDRFFGDMGDLDNPSLTMKTYLKTQIVFPILKLLKEGKKEEAKTLYIQSVLETQTDEKTGKISIVRDEQGRVVQKRIKDRFSYVRVEDINTMLARSELSKDLLYEMVLAEGPWLRSDAVKKARFNQLSSCVDAARVRGLYEREEQLMESREPYMGDINIMDVVYEREDLVDAAIKSNREYDEKVKLKIDEMRRKAREEKLAKEEAEADKSQRSSNDLESVLDGDKGPAKGKQKS